MHKESSTKDFLTNIDKKHHIDTDLERVKRGSLNMTDKHLVKDFAEHVTGNTTNKFKIGNNTEDVQDTLKGDLDSKINIRQTRSVLKTLRSMFYHDIPPTPERKPAIQPHLERSNDVNTNSSITELIENLTESVRLLNDNLAKLKLQARENIGFLLIKIQNMNESRYIENATATDLTRRKRDIGKIVNENLKNNQNDTNPTLENNTISFNLNKNGHGIKDAKDNIQSTIISDSEAMNIAKELSKSKRDVNLSNAETGTVKSTNNDTSSVNATLNNQDMIKQSAEVDLDKSKVKAGNSTDIQVVMSEEVSNYVNMLGQKKESRRFLNSKEDLLFFIENTYNDIKNLIGQMADVKDKYSDLIVYKIGYIIANLDIIDSALSKLKNRIFLHRNSWDMKRLQTLFRKLSMSKKLVTSVMGFLTNYDEKQHFIEQ